MEKFMRSILILMLLGWVGMGCAMPKSMKVRSGTDPRYQDDDVRFRTTYYFRVFEFCKSNINGQPIPIPELDSLYRFRMTGKGSSLFNTIHFESGTLHKSEVDPLGASIEFDEKRNRFRFSSTRDLEKQTELEIHKSKFEQLVGYKKTVETAKLADKTAFNDAIEKRLKALLESDLPDKDGGNGQESLGDGEKGIVTPNCPANAVTQKGFQILGPEGWRTFDQDERLIMAMSSSGKPLINALKELSGRVLNEQPSPAELILPVLKERVNITQAHRILDQFPETQEATPSDSSEQIVDEIIKALKFSEGENDDKASFLNSSVTNNIASNLLSGSDSQGGAK